MEFGDTVLWVILSLVLLTFFWLALIETFIPLGGVLFLWGPLVGYLISRHLNYRKKIGGIKPWQE
jgi:hypothetical protein